MNLRNVAIVAHVDHGKTTLVDQLLRQSGNFNRGELDGELIMDSNPIERERGITILAKNCAIKYKSESGEEYQINIVDTPGHADFSGEVERVISMADGVLLIVDSFEGVMPQTKYVLSKALDKGLKPIVIINKMDRKDAQPDRVINEVFDLLVDMGADDYALDFPVIYSSARDGWASNKSDIPEEGKGDIHAVFNAIIKHVPKPDFDEKAPLQAMITSLDYSKYLGRIAIGRVFAGTMNDKTKVNVINNKDYNKTETISKLFKFKGLGRTEADKIVAGDLYAVAGLEFFDIGDTIADNLNPVALPSISIDKPTIKMVMRPNDGPYKGLEGKFVTSRQLRDRLHTEIKSNVALKLEERGDEFVISGRGILHIGIMLENMRREGYEMLIGKPEVIFIEEDGITKEPIEMLDIDVPTEHVGTVMQSLGDRQATMINMTNVDANTHFEFKIASRALIGLRSLLLNTTQGQALVHHRFIEYDALNGKIPHRFNGVMIATETGKVTGHAIELLSDRGIMFVSPGDKVYTGQIIGEHCRENDIPVNITRQKKLNNIRSATKEATVTLKKPMVLDLETALEYIESDEYVEITPKSIRARKKILDPSKRKKRRDDLT